MLPQQMLRAARAHATFCRIIRHAFKLPFNRRSRKQSHAPRSLHAHHLQAAEFLCAQAHSDPNIWQAALQSPKHCTTVRLSVRAASRNRYELMHSLQEMTIYDLAHPAVNNTAPCWQSQFVSAAPHRFVPHSAACVVYDMICIASMALTHASAGRPRADQITSNQYSKRVPQPSKAAVDQPSGDTCEVRRNSC